MRFEILNPLITFGQRLNTECSCFNNNNSWFIYEEYNNWLTLKPQIQRYLCCHLSYCCCCCYAAPAAPMSSIFLPINGAMVTFTTHQPTTLLPITLLPITLLPYYLITLLPFTLLPFTLLPFTLLPFTLLPFTLSFYHPITITLLPYYPLSYYPLPYHPIIGKTGKVKGKR